MSGGRPATTGHWSAQPASAAPTSPARDGLRPKARWPELFAEAVEIDDNLRGKLAFAKEPYLHPLRLPLGEAVAIDETQLRDGLHQDGYGNECEGHCGV